MVIAGAQGREECIIPVWGQAALTTLEEVKPGCSGAAVAWVDTERAQSMQP